LSKVADFFAVVTQILRNETNLQSIETSYNDIYTKYIMDQSISCENQIEQNLIKALQHYVTNLCKPSKKVSDGEKLEEMRYLFSTHSVNF
jgi:hypothetical protein